MVLSSSLSETQFIKKIHHKRPQSLHNCIASKPSVFWWRVKDLHLDLRLTHPNYICSFWGTFSWLENLLWSFTMFIRSPFSAILTIHVVVLQMSCKWKPAEQEVPHCQVLWRVATYPREEPGGKTFEQKFYTAATEKKKASDKADIGTHSNSKFNLMAAAPNGYVHANQCCDRVV